MATWANQSNTTYWWNVSVNDTNGNWANATYHFKTDVYSWSNWSDWWTFDYSLGLPPVLSNPNPANGSTDVPVSTTIWNITIGDPEGNTFNWSIETTPDIGSNSSNDDTNGSKEVTIAGNLSYDTNYTVYVNATDIGSKTWTNETFWFDTEADTVTITWISQIPSNIGINSTGEVTILFNITTNGTAINSSSILVARVVCKEMELIGCVFILAITYKRGVAHVDFCFSNIFLVYLYVLPRLVFFCHIGSINVPYAGEKMLDIWCPVDQRPVGAAIFNSKALGNGYIAGSPLPDAAYFPCPRIVEFFKPMTFIAVVCPYLIRQF
ncbi:hypothetical protein ES703_81101 [subsurface metagenome]